MFLESRPDILPDFEPDLLPSILIEGADCKLLDGIGPEAKKDRRSAAISAAVAYRSRSLRLNAFRQILSSSLSIFEFICLKGFTSTILIICRSIIKFLASKGLLPASIS